MPRRRNQFSRTAVWLTIALCASSSAIATDALSDVLEGLERSSWRADESRTVEDLELRLGPAVVRLGPGTVVPIARVNGRLVEAIFEGEGRIVYEPADRVEAEQLELFAGTTTLDQTFRSAVLAIGDESLSKTIDALPRREIDSSKPPSGEPELFRAWTASGRTRADVPPRLVRALVDGAATGGAFRAIWLSSVERGAFLVRFDDAATDRFVVEQLSVDVATLEIDSLIDHDDEADDESERDGDSSSESDHGRHESPFVGLEPLWISVDAGGASPAVDRPPPVESVHYRIDATIEPDKRLVHGMAEVTLDRGSALRRVVTLDVADAVEIGSVEAGGQVVPHARVGPDTIVVLPDDDARVVQLEIRFSGRTIAEPFPGVFALRETRLWHPHVGEVDRATYDVTLRWPERWEVLASGEPLEAETVAGVRRERRRIVVPTAGATFEVGRFDTITDRVGHIDLRVGFCRYPGPVPEPVRREVVRAVKAALLFFETQLGWLEIDDFTVVSVPRRFSQGLHGFLSLAHELTGNSAGIAYRGPARSAQENRLETLAHEVAHQWWGNKLGWASYRDQWLSEALADFHAAQFMTRISSSEARQRMHRAAAWRSALDRIDRSGRRFDALGPVVLGTRLARNFGGSAYAAVVYDKGSVVFDMLARMVGERELLDALASIVARESNGVIDTATFLRYLEQSSGLELGPFADRFVYGSTLPEIHYETVVDAATDGGWSVTGEIEYVEAAAYGIGLVARGDSDWSIVRRKSTAQPAALPSIQVPYQVGFGDGAAAGEAVRGRGGVLEVPPGPSRVELSSADRPSLFTIDQRGELPARVFDRARLPRSSALSRARQRALEGAAAEARELLRAALDSPVRAGDEDAGPFELRLELVNLLLDDGRLEEAESELRRVEAELGRDPMYTIGRTALAARLEMRRRRFRPMFARLDALMRDREIEPAEVLRRARFPEDEAILRAMVLYGVAALETGQLTLAAEAARRAAERGADVRALLARIDVVRRR